MLQFSTVILKFAEQGEKTGWTYIKIPSEIAQKIKPDNKKSFRVKGKLDNYSIEKVALLPMGEGNFIMPFNAMMRKKTGKRQGEKLLVKLEEDKNPILLNEELVQCLADEPDALRFFNQLSKSHQLYFSKWIDAAKTDATKTKRIAQTLNALCKKQNFPVMFREMRNNPV